MNCGKSTVGSASQKFTEACVAVQKLSAQDTTTIYTNGFWEQSDLQKIVYISFASFQLCYASVTEPRWGSGTLPSTGEPGTKGTKPRPPNIGRMNRSSNLRQRRWTERVGAVRINWRLYWGELICPTSKSDPTMLVRSGSRIDWLESRDDVFRPVLGGMRRLSSGLVSRPKTWIKWWHIN